MKRTAQRKEMRLQLKTPHWRKLRKGVWKTDLGGDRPEVVILTMSNDEFREFRASSKAAKTYIDRRSLLKRKLIKVVFASVVPNKKGGSWFVIVTHTLWSTGGIVAWQTT